MPEFSCRLKTHLFLHLADLNLDQPTAIILKDVVLYCTYNIMSFCRYEAFNSIVRCQNIYGNWQSPSKDIAKNFATIENLRFLCDGGHHNNTMYVKHKIKLS